MGIVTSLDEFIEDWFNEIALVEALSNGNIIFRTPDWDNGEVPVTVFVNVPCGISHRIEEIGIPEPKPEKDNALCRCEKPEEVFKQMVVVIQMAIAVLCQSDGFC